jgi:hypothetical protein
MADPEEPWWTRKLTNLSPRDQALLDLIRSEAERHNLGLRQYLGELLILTGREQTNTEDSHGRI